MASINGTDLMARARVVASQTATDANQSAIIDSLGGIRSLMNNSIREVYRRKADNQKFLHDISVRHTVSISSGIGDCPAEVMREFLVQSQFEDDNDSFITYLTYNIDWSSGQLFDQLGYVTMQGDSFKYRAPSPDLDTYSGDLFVTAPTFPQFPADMTDPITFPSDSTIDDIALFMAQALMGGEKFQVISV